MKKAYTLNKGDWMGVQLAQPTLLTRITVADTLLANHTVVMSADGKQWKRVAEADFAPEGYVRFLGVVNDTEQPQSVKLVKKSLSLYRRAEAQVEEATIPEGNIWDNHGAGLMYDGDLTTFVCLNRNQQSGDTYVLKLTESQPIERVRVAVGTVNGDYMTEGREVAEDAGLERLAFRGAVP